MLNNICVAAPAKINIGLRVLPGTKNGYHDIESVFQTVPLFDILEVFRENAGIQESEKGRCIVECRRMLLPEPNTLTTAYHSFCALTGIQETVKVILEKRIPSGSGLGGASSDAAAFVKALDTLFETRLSLEGFMQIASAVGSDVFFFMLSGERQSVTAVVTGRGECVRQITPRKDLFFVLICPDTHSATGEAYGLVDDQYVSGEQGIYPALQELESVYYAPVQTWKFVNSFTEPVARKFPIIAEALADLKLSGALYTQMSGSGSAVFGVFESSTVARNAANLLAKKWGNCFALSPF
jgi:4-diphosphocytidyl-2-C-methyl-D-erythritol kinase